jgi:DNA processing protein
MTEPAEDLRFWLALLHAPRVGPTTFRQLLDRCETLDTLFEQPDLCYTRLTETLKDYLRNPDWDQVDSDLAWMGTDPVNHHILTLRSPAYPALLRELDDAPPVLFVHGNPEVLGHLQLAIVGSRNPTTGGARNAQDFAAHLASAGLTITAGLARPPRRIGGQRYHSRGTWHRPRPGLSRAPSGSRTSNRRTRGARL